MIDVPEGRDAEALGRWLKGHPGIGIVSRDRASGYSSAASSALPDAVQIADRFHVTKNLLGALNEAIEKALPQKIGIPVADAAKGAGAEPAGGRQAAAVKKKPCGAKTQRVADGAQGKNRINTDAETRGV